MISVNTSELEQLTEHVFKAAADCDEVLVLLRRIRTEMQEDIELQTYPQAMIADESLGYAVESLNRGNDTLQSLKGVLAPLASQYEENESNGKNAIGRMTEYLGSLQAGLAAADLASCLPVAIPTDEAGMHEQVKQLIAQDAEEMAAANVASVSRVIEEEYELNQVLPMDDSE